MDVIQRSDGVTGTATRLHRFGDGSGHGGETVVMQVASDVVVPDPTGQKQPSGLHRTSGHHDDIGTQIEAHGVAGRSP